MESLVKGDCVITELEELYIKIESLAKEFGYGGPVGITTQEAAKERLEFLGRTIRRIEKQLDEQYQSYVGRSYLSHYRD
jgi:hypothetical protein